MLTASVIRIFKKSQRGFSLNFVSVSLCFGADAPSIEIYRNLLQSCFFSFACGFNKLYFRYNQTDLKSVALVRRGYKRKGNCPDQGICYFAAYYS